MPRPMMRTRQQNQTQTNVALNTSYDREQRQRQQQMDKMKLDRLLRKKRSKTYMDAMHKLDAGGQILDPNKVNELLNAIRGEFPDVEIASIMLGVVAKCYLGNPYEVHTLDMMNQIIEHFKLGQPLPNGMERARGIAIHGGYDFIEVYVDCCRAISSNGSVAVISN